MCLYPSALRPGVSRAQLEAFLLGTPVVARRNAGNAALVAHGRTGLLFETADEAVAQAGRLLDEPGLGAQLAAAAAAQVARGHSSQAEADGYRAALQLALDAPVVSTAGATAGGELARQRVQA